MPSDDTRPTRASSDGASFAILARISCSSSMKARCYVDFRIVWRENLRERTADVIRCTSQDRSPAVLLIGDI